MPKIRQIAHLCEMITFNRNSDVLEIYTFRNEKADRYLKIQSTTP